MVARREGEVTPVPRIRYIDGPRLRRALISAVAYVTLQRDELNRINVFPVPDGDTGTNLVLTLRSVADAVEPLGSRSVASVAREAAEAGILGARGNSGMLFSRFLDAFARTLEQRARVGVEEVAEALAVAANSLRDVLENPTEGTIITVAEDLAAEGLRRASDRVDLYWWLRDVQEAARRSLARTTELLPALRDAGVVDAGALGFVSFFDGIVGYIDGRPVEPPPTPGPEVQPILSALESARRAGVGTEEGRYCTQIAVRGVTLPAELDIRKRLAGLGTSLIVLRTTDVAKVHIHTDTPSEIRAILAEMGEIASDRVEDTKAVGPARSVAIVTDSSSDLAAEWVEANGVTVVPMEVVVEDVSYRDGIDLSGEQLEALLASPAAPRITTSQPSPQAFTAAYRRVLDAGAEQILGIYVGSALSGTYGSGVATLTDLGVPFRAVDSRTASLGLGFLVERAAELIDEGRALDDVVTELRRIRDRSNLFFTVDTFEYLLRSGRVGRARAWLGSRLDIKPILTLDREGRVVKAAAVRGRPAQVRKMVELLDEALAGAARYRLGVIHFSRPEFAETLADRLRERFTPIEVLVRPVTATISVHTGPGAWGVVYQVED